MRPVENLYESISADLGKCCEFQNPEHFANSRKFRLSRMSNTRRFSLLHCGDNYPIKKEK